MLHCLSPALHENLLRRNHVWDKGTREEKVSLLERHIHHQPSNSLAQQEVQNVINLSFLESSLCSQEKMEEDLSNRFYSRAGTIAEGSHCLLDPQYSQQMLFLLYIFLIPRKGVRLALFFIIAIGAKDMREHVPQVLASDQSHFTSRFLF